MHPNAKDLRGKRFGKLTVREPTGERSDNKIVWLCDCDCGGTRTTISSRLIAGHARSCGCALSEAARKLTVGQRYGRWVIVGYAGKSHWQCRCDCGGEAAVLASNLTKGHSRSCGCLRHEQHSTHGLSNHPLYKRWHAMLQRCENPNHTSFQHYGGRGIRVCADWHDFPSFLADVGAPPSSAYSLDRIDTNGDYTPGNVRWATMSQQLSNRRTPKQVALTQASEADLRAALARLLAHKTPKSGVETDQT